MTWTPSQGNWTLVVMHSDGTPGIAAGLAIAGLLLLVGGVVMVLLPITKASRRHHDPQLGVRSQGSST